VSVPLDKCKKKPSVLKQRERPILNDTSKTAKLTLSTQVSGYNTVIIISTAHVLMKLIVAVLDMSLTMGLKRRFKTEGLLAFIFAVLYIFHAISIRYTRLRRRKSTKFR